MRPHRGVSVDQLRKAVDVDPMTEPNVLVLRGQHSFEDEDAADALDTVLQRLKANIPGMQLADMALPSYRILDNVSNDPDDSMFAPDDQFLIVYEAMKRADVILVSSHACYGFPSCLIVRLLERLKQKAELNAKEKTGVTALFDGKPVAVILNGTMGVYSAAVMTAGAFSKLGCTVVRNGVAFWEGEQGSFAKNKEIGPVLDRVASDIGDLCAALKR